MSPIYAIGDIHGQKEMLDHALGLISADGGENAQIVFLGDYTDRGPDSRAVVETLIAGRDAGRNWVFIKGNHDRLFTRFVREGREHDLHIRSGVSWLNRRLGGEQTLASYGIHGVMHFAQQPDPALEILTHFEGQDCWIEKEALQALASQLVPEAHLAFLERLPLWHQTDDLFFVHAGLRPGLPLAFQDPEDLL